MTNILDKTGFDLITSLEDMSPEAVTLLLIFCILILVLMNLAESSGPKRGTKK